MSTFLSRASALLTITLLATALAGVAPAAAAPGGTVLDQLRASCGTDWQGYKASVPEQGEWATKTYDLDDIWKVTRGAGITVAVVDSGVSFTHVQMRNVKRVAGTTFSGPNTTDCFGHGTGVASIIAAQRVVGVDFRGLAPDVTIMPIKIQQAEKSEGNEGLPLAADAINYAVDHGARVINLSLNGQADRADVRQALAKAEAKRVVVVGAADNTGLQTAVPVPYPASYPTVLAVASIDQNGQRSNFSTQGSFIDVAAPGNAVEVATPIPNDTKFTITQGTSFAAPVVSAVAALILSVHPDLTAAQVRSRIERTAFPPPGSVPSPGLGYGTINPYLAVTAAFNDAAPTASSTQGGSPAAVASVIRPDDGARHRAIGVGLGLIGLTILTALAARLTRSGRGRGWRPARG